MYVCGASLISPEVVLTSGHCVNNTEELEGKLVVRCGEWDTQRETEAMPHQDISVKTILVLTAGPVLSSNMLPLETSRIQC